MSNIVIFDTFIGTSNVGDAIIMRSVEEEMDYFFSSKFSLRLATHVNNFTLGQTLRRNSKYNYFSDSDYKFVCGTNLIQQKRLGKVNPQWQINLSNIPILKNSILIGVGATTGGTKLDPLAKHAYKKVLSHDYVHSVRDEQTREIIESIGFSAINTGCPTLWSLTKEHCNKIPTKKSEHCVMSVSGYNEQKDPAADQEMINIICDNYKEIYVWIQTIEDEKYFDSLNIPKNIKKVYSLTQYDALLKEGNIDYIGTRLHGGVFAMQRYVRSLIVSIDHRARGFNQSNNLPIIERADISSKLNSMINSEWSTDIKLNEIAIRKFKEQFK